MRARTVVVVAVTGVVVAIGGCGSDGDEPQGLEASTQAGETTRAEVTPTPTPTDAAELRDVYDSFWDAVVEAENGPDTDPALFDGIASAEIVEIYVARAREWEELEVNREGEPRIENITVSIDGDSARIEACKDETDWKMMSDGEPVPLETDKPSPFVVTAKRGDDGWLIDSELPPSEATITCT